MEIVRSECGGSGVCMEVVRVRVKIVGMSVEVVGSVCVCGDSEG